MVDPVGSVKQVLQVALKIKEAVDTVRSNKEVCHQIRGRVNRLRAILSKLEDADADAVDDPATADTLKDLEETLHRAYSLVAACQEDRNMVSLLFSAGKLSRNLRQVNEDILAQMAIASFGNNVRTTIMLTKHFQDSPKGDAEHGMTKTDVYGYGVLLLETISGKSCIQADSDFNILSAWVSAQLLNISFFRNSKLHKTPGVVFMEREKIG
uniref:Uncharacterized protein n=1 Tax=Avena sativa TaxID=4498 RepID=A0ACD5Z212_AVESA